MDSFNEALVPATVDGVPAGGPLDASLHVEADAICPRCLDWIGPTDYVRRNGYGLLQHEGCQLIRQRGA
jgi:hypothetical protein